MFSMLHHFNDVFDMVGSFCEDGHRIDLVVLDQCFQRRVRFGALVRLHETLTPFRAQVTHSFDYAVRVFVPLKTAAKSAAHHTDTNLPGGRIDGQRAGGYEREASQYKAALLEEITSG